MALLGPPAMSAFTPLSEGYRTRRSGQALANVRAKNGREPKMSCFKAG
jgi:hypothetical protein